MRGERKKTQADNWEVEGADGRLSLRSGKSGKGCVCGRAGDSRCEFVLSTYKKGHGYF